MELFIIRHGQSVGNTVKHDMPDCELTELGRSQAETVTRCMEGANLTHIISSPLIRAITTAQPLAQATGLPIRVWVDTYEVRNKGPVRGPTKQALENAYEGIVVEDEMESDGWFYPGNETSEMGHQRANRILQRLKREFPGNERVALFAHGGFNTCLLHEAIGLDHTSKVRFPGVNCCMYWLSFGEQSTVVEYIGAPRPLFD